MPRLPADPEHTLYYLPLGVAEGCVNSFFYFDILTVILNFGVVGVVNPLGLCW